MILVISHAGDMHSKAVIHALRVRGHSPVLLDLSRFPALAQIELGYGKYQRGKMQIQDRAWGDIDLRQCHVSWWRRPQPFHIPLEVTDPASRAFAINEAREVFGGLWGLLDSVWVNDPQRDDLAHRKSYQLRLAEIVGLAIPDTLITNAPDAARDFIAHRGRNKVAFKAFCGTPRAWRETRLIREDELNKLDLVCFAPVIFQEYIDGVDVRVTVIGDRIYPAEIDISNGDYPVDFRMNYDHLKIRPTHLPNEVESQIHNLMSQLGLIYGAIDLRRTHTGDYIFLEINPAGQWLFVEQQTGQPITDAIAETLVANNCP